MYPTPLADFIKDIEKFWRENEKIIIPVLVLAAVVFAFRVAHSYWKASSIGVVRCDRCGKTGRTKPRLHWGGKVDYVCANCNSDQWKTVGSGDSPPPGR